jgi:exodeoxyribonuclease VII small subunit
MPEIRMSKPEKKITFEAHLSKLEKLVEELEAGQVPLETLMKRYEEGRAIVQWCDQRLQEAELKIIQLSSRSLQESKIATQAFEPDTNA